MHRMNGYNPIELEEVADKCGYAPLAKAVRRGKLPVIMQIIDARKSGAIASNDLVQRQYASGDGAYTGGKSTEEQRERWKIKRRENRARK